MLREAYAMGTQPSGQPSGSPLVLLWPWIMIFGIFYLLVFRPQRVKQRELEKKISELEKGDKIVTSGGVLGIVVGVKEKTVMVKVADNVKIEMLRSSVSHVEKAKAE